jgi:hypothetical protein
MRAALGFAGLHLVFVVTGLALLYALGFVTRVRHVPFAIGPAYLAGLAAVMSALVLLLVVGVAVRLPQLAAVAGAMTVSFGAIGYLRMRSGRSPDDHPPAPYSSAVEAWLTRGSIAVLALFLAIGATSFSKLPTVGDDWTIWSYKALAFFHFGGNLHHETFLQEPFGAAHADYPILQPLLESLFFRAMGGVHLQEFHIALWIIFAAFVWTLAFLVRSCGSRLTVLLGPLAAVTLASGAVKPIATGYADGTVACFAAAAVLCFGLWLDDGRARYALLGAILLGAAANTKNEGLAAAAVVLLAALVVLLLARLPRWWIWLAATAIVSAATVPWVAWRSSHDLTNGDLTPVADALSWSFLTDRGDRLGQAFGKLLAQLGSQGVWLWIVPCFLLLAVSCIVARPDLRRQAGFYLAVATLMLLSAVWVYWTGRLAIGGWLYYSADRIVTTVVFVCAGGLLHLLARTLAAEEPGSLSSRSPRA